MHAILFSSGYENQLKVCLKLEAIVFVDPQLLAIQCSLLGGIGITPLSTYLAHSVTVTACLKTPKSQAET